MWHRHNLWTLLGWLFTNCCDPLCHLLQPCQLLHPSHHPLPHLHLHLHNTLEVSVRLEPPRSDSSILCSRLSHTSRPVPQAMLVFGASVGDGGVCMGRCNRWGWWGWWWWYKVWCLRFRWIIITPTQPGTLTTQDIEVRYGLPHYTLGTLCMLATGEYGR